MIDLLARLLVCNLDNIVKFILSLTTIYGVPSQKVLSFDLKV